MSALEETVVYLTGGGKTTQSQLKEAIGIVRESAEREGLDSDVLERLMHFVVEDTNKNGVGVAHRCQVLRTLIPKTVVTLSTVLTALGAMGDQPLSLKKLLFQWIVLVYDIVEGRGTTLHALYDVILYYIHYDELRSIVCQLLCYLTRREDVKEYRVLRLTEVKEQVLVSKEVSESGLLALLAVYKRHCPHLVKCSVSTRRKTWFKPFEKKLAANILRVQSQRASGALGSTASSLNSQLESLPPPAKRSKVTSTVPTIHPSHLHSSHSDGDSSRVPVVQLSSLSELCSNIDNLELPGQMAAVLESYLCRHAFCLNPDPSAVCRLTYWLQHSLGYELDCYTPGAAKNSALLHMLSCLKTLTEFILEPIPVVESFLSILLEVWNGEDYQEEVCGLLEHLSLQQFSELKRSYLDPLRALFQEKDLAFRRLILITLTALFRNLVTLEWPRSQRKREATGEDVVPWSLFYESADEEDDDSDFDPRDTLRQFTNYVGNMIEFALREDCSHPLIQHNAASFYEIATELPVEYGIPLICVPRPFIVFNLLLSCDASALDRILSCFVMCKRSFTSMKKEERGVENTHTFNSTVLDLCDSLWKNCAFSSKRRPYPTLLFKLSKEQLTLCRLDNVSDKLSMIHHPAFLGFVLEFFKETQDPSKHFQPKAIWQEDRFRQSYLDYLHHCNLTGIVSFIKNFIR